MQLTTAEKLRTEAERCFRLAQGIAEARLADELEAIGQAFEREAALIESADDRDLPPPRR